MRFAALRALPASTAFRASRDFFLRCRSFADRTLWRSPLPTSRNLLLVVVATLGELERSLPCGIDRIQECCAHAGFLEVTDRSDGGAAG